MVNRLPFPDPDERVGKDILKHAYEIQIRFNFCEHRPVVSCHVDVPLNQPNAEEDGTARVDWDRLYDLPRLIRSREGREG